VKGERWPPLTLLSIRLSLYSCYLPREKIKFQPEEGYVLLLLYQKTKKVAISRQSRWKTLTIHILLLHDRASIPGRGIPVSIISKICPLCLRKYKEKEKGENRKNEKEIN
jgi:hypothetical protein